MMFDLGRGVNLYLPVPDGWNGTLDAANKRIVITDGRCKASFHYDLYERGAYLSWVLVQAPGYGRRWTPSRALVALAERCWFPFKAP